MLASMADSISRKRDDIDLSLLPKMGQNWYKRFIGRHPDLSLIYSRKLDQSRAMNNNPKILWEFFELLKSVVEKYNITSDRTFNMNEKGFLLSYAQSAKVIVHSSKKSYDSLLKTETGNW